jgi:hypothetical protein
MPLSFKYPITKADGSEFKSAKELLSQLSGESAGFYLLSANAFWHGGLHISDEKPFAQVKVVSLGAGDAGSVALGDTVWISSAEGDVAREPVIPDPFNSVVICDPPLPIEAGATIGYLGLYETPAPGDEGKTSRQQVHVEIFTGDPKFGDFFASAAGLTEGRKYKMAGTNGAPAKASTSGGANTFAPGTDPLLLPVAVDTTASLAKQDSLHKNWFPVEGIGDSGVLNGWVPESRLKDVVQYDWEKLGFRKVEEANDHADGYIDPEKVPAFFKSIYKLIHKSTEGEVTPDELLAANHNSVVRNALAHVVARHPSEWQGKADAAKWNVIKEHEALLKNDPKRLKHELERIDALSWWDEIKGVKDFPMSSNVWHFNPVMFVEVIGADFKFTLEMMKCLFPNIADSRGDDLQAIADELNAHIKFYQLDTCLRREHFFAQVMQETGKSLSVEEGFIWKASALKSSFSYFRKNPVEADAHGYADKKSIRADGQKMVRADYIAIANGAYGGRDDLGNGDQASGDGWMFRGRGLKQLTGDIITLSLPCGTKITRTSGRKILKTSKPARTN